MLTPDQLLLNDEFSVMEDVAKRNVIIHYGIIKEVLSNRIVQVETSCYVGEIPLSATCVYLSYTGKHLNLQIIPSVGDKVLLASPMMFAPEMFSEEESILLEEMNGYRLNALVAIPLWANVKNKENTSTVLADANGLSFNTKGDIVANSGSDKTIQLNGNEKSFVTYAALNDALQDIWSAIKGHTHTVSTTGSASAQSGTAAASTSLASKELDISGAECTKVKTS